ncbi:MAG: hypothetical protein A2Z31_02375 [candidate division NC10 bacterium RBG_16_65_8]|nr:MAG: hypothetical protein A2Z31_02375 [candidate division NC10 bacterium RBG_16_65_8]
MLAFMRLPSNEAATDIDHQNEPPPVDLHHDHQMLPTRNVRVEPREENDFRIVLAPANLLRESENVTNALQKRGDGRMALEDVSPAFIGEFHRLPQGRWVSLDGHLAALYIRAVQRAAGPWRRRRERVPETQPLAEEHDPDRPHRGQGMDNPAFAAAGLDVTSLFKAEQIGVSESLFASGLCLPSGTGMSESELERVAGCVLSLARAG